MIIEPQFGELHGVSEWADEFREGLAMIEIDWRKGFINKTGAIVIAPQFQYGYHFVDGLACVSKGLNEKWGYIDKTGNWAIKPVFDDASMFSEDWADVKKNGVCLYIDKTGKTVLQPKFQNDRDCSTITGSFNQGLARWRNGEKFGYINKKSAFIIEPNYQTTDHFAEGMARVGIKGKQGFINQTGRLVVPARFSHVDSFANGLARVVTDEGVGYIDKTGKYVWKPSK